jgi:competence protein ComGC
MRTFLTITRLFITTLLCILIAFCILLIVVMYPNLTKEKEKEQSIYNKERINFMLKHQGADN